MEWIQLAEWPMIFDPESEGSTFSPNVDDLLPDYTASYLEDGNL
jgi:hypothetical protein